MVTATIEPDDPGLLRQLMRSTLRILGFMLFLMACVAALLLYGWLRPDDAPGYLSFQAVYHGLGPVDGLRVYQQRLEQANGGHLPPSVDQYLSRRLRHPRIAGEQRAILGLVARQGSERHGLFLPVSTAVVLAEAALD